MGFKTKIVTYALFMSGSCRYNSNWLDDYKENLHKFFVELKEILPKESLIIWNLTMPLGRKIRGGFLVSEVGMFPPPRKT